MTSRRLLPYKSISDGDITWDSWWFEREGIRQPLPTHLPGWDYASRETIGITVDVNGPAVLESTCLSSLTSLELVLVADCPALGRRFVSSEPLTDEPFQRLELAVDIPAGEAASKLELSVHLVLSAPLPRKSRVASVSGARVGWSPRFNLHLEGESSRFPTDAVTFAEVNLEEAPWTLSTSFVDLDDSFMGSVRLLINDAHPLGQAVLGVEQDPVAAERLKLDVFRMLVAATNDHARETSGSYDDDSVGAVIASMCELYLRRTLTETAALYRDEPLKFERLCYQVASA